MKDNMAIIVFHGDNPAASRTQLQTALAVERSRGSELLSLEGDKISPPDLENALLTDNLFTPTALVIENLLTRLRSRDKDRCLALLTNYAGPKNIYLWEKKETTKLTLNKFPKATKITLAKTPTALFALLESLRPGSATQSLSLLHQVVAVTEDIVAFTMVARQISQLLQVRAIATPKLSPWQLTKLQSQTKSWTEAELIHFHDELVRIDFAIKTGRSKLSYADHLDILFTTLLR